MGAQIHLKRTSESEAIFIETLHFILGTYIYHGVDLFFLTCERTNECGGTYLTFSLFHLSPSISTHYFLR
jgi:hypothetical protein